MWEIYDRLIADIEPGTGVKSVNVGVNWTAVTAQNGNIGLAMTTNVQTIKRTVGGFEGMELRTLAELVKSWNFIEASIGMAAINAWYNSPKRRESLGAQQPADEYCDCGFETKGKNIVMVGRMRNADNRFREAASLKILEREAKEGTYPDSACEYLIPQSDMVIITGSAFVNKTMPRLLELANDGQIATEPEKRRKGRTIIITGPSAPMCPEIMDFGIDRIAGMVVTKRDAMEAFVSDGMRGTPYTMGEKYCLDR